MIVSKKPITTHTYSLEGLTEEDFMVLRDALRRVSANHHLRNALPTSAQRATALALLRQMNMNVTVKASDEEDDLF